MLRRIYNQPRALKLTCITMFLTTAYLLAYDSCMILLLAGNLRIGRPVTVMEILTTAAGPIATFLTCASVLNNLPRWFPAPLITNLMQYVQIPCAFVTVVCWFGLFAAIFFGVEIAVQIFGFGMLYSLVCRLCRTLQVAILVVLWLCRPPVR